MSELIGATVEDVQAESGLLGEITAPQLRYVIDDICHQIHHLERSNDELRVELEQEYDAEYAEAVSENMVVVLRMKSRVKRYLEVLRQIDLAYAVEHDTALTVLFDTLHLANVDANTGTISSMDLGAASNRGGEVIEIVVGGARQVGAEQHLLRILSGTGEGEGERGAARASLPEARAGVEVKAQPEDDDGRGGLYL